MNRIGKGVFVNLLCCHSGKHTVCRRQGEQGVCIDTFVSAGLLSSNTIGVSPISAHELRRLLFLLPLTRRFGEPSISSFSSAFSICALFIVGDDIIVYGVYTVSVRMLASVCLRPSDS